MGLFDGGFFGDFFDLDNDGRLDSFERSMDTFAFVEMIRAEEENDEDEDF